MEILVKRDERLKLLWSAQGVGLGFRPFNLQDPATEVSSRAVRSV